MPVHDLVIRGGTIADGAGGDPFEADLAIDGGRISAVGRITAKGREEIDATGRLVTPGFVDIHTHYDGQSIWSERLSPSSAHGVTTAILGNCGVGFAPCRPEDHELLINVMEGVEDIPGVVMAEGLDWSWETFPEYLDALDSRRRDIDVAAYLPHSPLRVYAMGERGAAREAATAEDLARMRALAREAIEAGGIGFATSRIEIHRRADGENIPSFDADAEELKAIAAGLGDAGAGTLQMVLNSSSRPSVDEVAFLIDVAESSGRPATFSLAASNDGPPTWMEALDLVHAANARGASITAQVLPRPVGMLAGLELSVDPFAFCPSYRPVADLPLEQRVAALRDPELRRKILSEEIYEGHAFATRARRWQWMFPLTDPPNYAPATEDSVLARAAAAGVTPEEWAYDHLVSGDGRNMFYITLTNFPGGRIDDLETMLKHPDCVLGLGDGGAHYGAICDASYPTFLLKHWVEREQRLTVAEAIRMLARKPAEAVGLRDRGLLKAGMKADVNVIDLDRLHLPAPHVVNDLPGGGRRITQGATGYDATIVSGEIIHRFDTPTGRLPGKLVRGVRAEVI